MARGRYLRDAQSLLMSANTCFPSIESTRQSFNRGDQRIFGSVLSWTWSWTRWDLGNSFFFDAFSGETLLEGCRMSVLSQKAKSFNPKKENTSKNRQKPVTGVFDFVNYLKAPNFDFPALRELVWLHRFVG